jgi:hypothetical protein
MGGKRAVHQDNVLPGASGDRVERALGPELDRPFLAASTLVGRNGFRCRSRCNSGSADKPDNRCRFPPAERCFRLWHHPRVHSRTICKVELVHSTALYTGTLIGIH